MPGVWGERNGHAVVLPSLLIQSFRFSEGRFLHLLDDAVVSVYLSASRGSVAGLLREVSCAAWTGSMLESC